jgi:glycosyltransferase involved in cell wall biosynthesis
MISLPRWDVLTGEYPPQPGGVSDYTQLVAEGLASRGSVVHVWAPPTAIETGEALCNGVVIHRPEGGWSAAGLARVGEALGPPGGRRLLTQYTPNAWGLKGVNLGFCRWLAARGRGGDHVRLMFHELFYYARLRDRPSRLLLPPVHRWMLRTALSACARIDYATEEWGRLLRRYPAARRRPMAWRPVPSTIPVVDDPGGVADVRRRVAPRGETVVGHFGSFGDDQRRYLHAVLPRLLEAHPGRVGLLIGRGGERFAAEAAARYPGLAGRLTATGGLEPADVSRHLQACDVMVQAYPDGVCARRTTAMAAMAHGLPVASTRGRFTEPVFVETGCVALAPEDRALDGLFRLAEALVAEPDARAPVGSSARRAYEQHFALGRTLDALLDDDAST